MARHRHHAGVLPIIAVPPPSAAPAIRNPPPAGDAVRGGFKAAVKALTVRAPKPAPKKRRRNGDDDKGRAAMVRKHMRRLYRKVARKAGEGRDDRPTFDSDWWHRHQQSVADISSNEQERGFRTTGPNYPSPTL
jgi:hypothetical protein